MVSQKWSYEYDEVSVIDTSIDINNNSLIFSLEVNSNHNHAAVGGKLIDTYTFNGTRWLEEYDDSGCATDWHIVGVWEYLTAGEPRVYVYGNDPEVLIYGCEIFLDSFDQINGKAEGICSFYSPELVFTHQEQDWKHRDLAYAEIEITEDSVTIEWDLDKVHIGLDDASCEFLSGGSIHQIGTLEFIDRAADNTSEFDLQDVATWRSYIDSYFERKATGNEEEILNYLSSNGVLGDDMEWLWENHVVQYSVGGIHHSPGFTALMSNELDLELSEANLASIDDFAEIYVNVVYEEIGVIPYKFDFVNVDGTWRLFFIDD